MSLPHQPPAADTAPPSNTEPAVDDLVPADEVPDAVAGLMPGALDDAFDPWNYRDSADPDPQDLAGFHVEAEDGRIGVVDAASHTLDDGYLVVDIGVWIFGRTVMLPAGTVKLIDRNERVVYLDRTKDQVKASPDVDVMADPANRASIGDYYRGTYRG
jgi:hypothetical protein